MADSLTRREVTGTWVNSLGEPWAPDKQIQFSLRSFDGVLNDEIDNVIIVAMAPIPVTLDETGSMSIDLITNDNENIAQQNYNWRLDEMWEGGRRGLYFPLPSGDDPYDLSQLIDNSPPFAGTIVVVEGPGGRGPKGDAGEPGQPRFTGHGMPGVLPTAEPGDLYLDLDSYTLYQFA